MNIIAFLLFVALLGSIWQLPSATFALGIALLFFSLATAIYSIFQNHKYDQNHRPKIFKDILVLILSLLLILLLGGLVGRFANDYISTRLGVVAGFLSAIAASFSVGYLVRKGMGRLSR